MILKYLKTAPFIALIIMAVNFLVVYANSNLAITKQNYIGISFIAAAFLLFLIRRDFAYMLTGLILLLGSLSLISLTPVVYVFKIKNLIELDLIFLPIFFAYIYIFRNDIPKWIEGE